MTEAELAEKLSKYNWGAIGETLTAFVIKYMNYCTGQKYLNWNFPDGNRAEDIAYKAIADVLGGTRAWDPLKHPDLIKYMEFSVCRSIISNLYAKANSRQTTSYSQSDYSSGSADDDFDYYNGSHINFGLHFEQEIDNDLFLSELSESLKDDPEAQDVLLLILEFNQNKEISLQLKITEPQVSNAKKRIKRAADKIIRSST